MVFEQVGLDERDLNGAGGKAVQRCCDREVEWTATGSRITVAHPQYPAQRHTMFVYEVTGSVPPIRFAAGEFSNGAWGFYVPDPPEV